MEFAGVFGSDLCESSALKQIKMLLKKDGMKTSMYKDLRNKAQGFCTFLPSCKSSYVNSVANLFLEGSDSLRSSILRTGGVA